MPSIPGKFVVSCIIREPGLEPATAGGVRTLLVLKGRDRVGF